MDFGVHIGARGAADNPDGITTIARHCEALGYAYLGVSDHVIISREVDSHYPYNEAGIWPGTGSGTCLEQLTTLSYIAAVTERIRLLTSVMVLPYRPPVQTAKILASLDVLSNGRLTGGAGTGWNAEEMIALGSPPFDRRGKASNEYLDAFITLWTRDEPTYAGEFVSFDNVIFEPKPVQDPHPPIWIGGEGSAARRRAGKFGDGWYPVGRNPHISLETPELFIDGVGEVRRHAEASGRDPTVIDTAMSVPWYRLGEPGKKPDGSRIVFTGSAEQIAEDARGFRDVGLNHLIIAAEYTELQQSLDEFEQFAKEVVPLVN